MSLKSTLEEIVSKHLPNDTYYLVDVQLVEKGPKSQLTILIDADQGVSIEACAKVSRQIAEEIEAKELLSDAYILEVSSPGLDFPLSSKRQYTKNVGRTLKVTLNDGKELEGQLLDVGNAEVKISCKIKVKGKKAEDQEITIPLEQIKKSIVLVSFK
jgi:ribosome maturation factor RimP